MNREEIQHRFTYHPPKEGQPAMYKQLRAGFLLLATLMNDLCPDSRELSLAMTRLEEANIWANASIARNGHQVVAS
jgi:hypothetical protein